MLNVIASALTFLVVGIAAGGPGAAQTPSNHQFTRVASGLAMPTFLAFDSQGDLYVTNRGDGTISRIELSTGRIETFARGLGRPQGLAFDKNGNLIVADAKDNTLQQIGPGGSVRHLATLDKASRCRTRYEYEPTAKIRCADVEADPAGLAFDGQGRLWVATFLSGTVTRIETQAPHTVVAGKLGPLYGGGPLGLAADRAGNLYASISSSNAILKVGADGSLIRLPTQQLAKTHDGHLLRPGGTIAGLAVAHDGSLFFAGADRHVTSALSRGLIRKMHPGGEFGVLAVGMERPWGIAFDRQGNRFVADSGNRRILRLTKDDTESVFASFDDKPGAIAFDPQDNLYVAMEKSNTIISIARDGRSSVFVAEGLDQPRGLAFDGAGALFVTNAAIGTVTKFAPGSKVGTTIATGLVRPGAIAIDRDGFLHVASSRDNSLNHSNETDTITKMNANGEMQRNALGEMRPFTVKGLFAPGGLAFDSNGNLFVSLLFASAVMKITTAGTTELIRSFSMPTGLAFDSVENLHVVNNAGYSIRVIARDGTIASGFTGLSSPLGVALDGRGNLYVTNDLDGTIARMRIAH